jgi:hypothetical protein
VSKVVVKAVELYGLLAVMPVDTGVGFTVYSLRPREEMCERRGGLPAAKWMRAGRLPQRRVPRAADGCYLLHHPDRKGV